MKVYVDELPKGATEYGCDNCPYAEVLGINQYIINGEFMSYRDCICKLDKTCGFRQGEKHCLLKSLSDYTKQVRKEVLDELMNMLVDRAELIDFGNGCAEFMFTTYDLQECSKVILDQIQGESGHKQ